MKKEQFNENQPLRETAVSSCVFYNQMYKAFKHGIEFELIKTDGEMDVYNTEDNNLPFSEWFNKYFRKPMTDNLLLEYGFTQAGFTCAENQYGMRNELNQFLNRIRIENNVFIHIDSGKEIKYSYELEAFLT